MVGLNSLAKACDKTHQAVRKWQRAGRLPRTEWTGETQYASKIEQLCAGRVTAQQLLGPWPKWPADGVAPTPASPAASAVAAPAEAVPPSRAAPGGIERRDLTRPSRDAGSDIDRRAPPAQVT